MCCARSLLVHCLLTKSARLIRTCCIPERLPLRILIVTFVAGIVFFSVARSSSFSQTALSLFSSVCFVSLLRVFPSFSFVAFSFLFSFVCFVSSLFPSFSFFSSGFSASAAFLALTGATAGSLYWSLRNSSLIRLVCQ